MKIELSKEGKKKHNVQLILANNVIEIVTLYCLGISLINVAKYVW